MEKLSKAVHVRFPPGDYARLVLLAEGRPLSTLVALMVRWFLDQPADMIQEHVPPAPKRGQPQ